jgi:CHAT domain-containing protein
LAVESNYLHLSTHGVAERELPLLSRVLLEPTATDDGNLTVREIFELGLRTDLVTLSACETGRSFSAGAGEFTQQDRIGLIEAFLHAGSDSVLGSLVPISDQPTMAFMKRFYAELGRKQPRTQALAATQRAMLRGEIGLPLGSNTSSALTHPKYWAPFILVGDYR